jgi:hypothetical protein
MKNIYLYGYQSDSELFQSLSNSERAEWFKDQGIAGVFGGYEDRDFTREMHNRGLKVFASFKCFAGSDEWDRNPECRPITSEGTPLEQIEWYRGLNPANKSLQNERLQSLKELLYNSDIDGVWFDFIRWPCKWEKEAPQLLETSFDRDTVEQFLLEYNLALKGNSPESWSREILTSYDREWRAFRVSVVTKWLEQAYSLVKSCRSDLLVGVFTVPWINEERNNGLERILGQNIDGMSAFTDIFSPMVYHKICHRPLDWIGQVSQWYDNKTKKKVWPIIQSADIPPGSMNNREYEKTWKYAQTLKGSNIIVFTLEEHFSQLALI